MEMMVEEMLFRKVAGMTVHERASLSRRMKWLGRDLYYGRDGVSVDRDEAIMWYKRAGRLGDANSMMRLGEHYKSLNDYETSYFWFLEAALRGERKALLKIAYMYFQGYYVNQDFEKAHSFFLKAREARVRQSYFYLGLFEEEGYLKDPDPEKAVEYYRRGSVGYVAGCAVNLACMYHFGKGVPVDREKSSCYFKRAYHLGRVYTEPSLSTTYEPGLAVQQTIGKALFDVRLGTDLTSESSRKALIRLHAEEI